MNLVCFPSTNPLHDLVLPLHLRPARVWLPTTPIWRAEADRLAGCLERQGLALELLDWPLFAETCAHADHVMKTLGRVLDQAADREVMLALGESAGPWELVCQQVLRQLMVEGEFRVLVLTADARHMVQVEPGPVRVEILPSLLEPADYLAACNATLRGSASAEHDWGRRVTARRMLTFHLACECAAIGSALGTLNWLARQTVDRDSDAFINPKQQLPRTPAGPLRAALEQAADAGMVDFDGDRELIFCTAEACAYLSGGWLEEYAWLTASELGAEHVHAGLELTWNAGSGATPRNELDLFVLHCNRALTVECKTSQMGDGDVTAKILYKLDSIADRLSSLPGNAVLLSAREVPEMIVKRARAQGVAVFDAERLTAFRDWLGEWLDD